MPDCAVPVDDPRRYMRLAALLRAQIAGGTLRPGSAVPSITVLCGEYGYARATCGRALRVLAGEGLLVLVPGLGYYVAAVPGPGDA